MNPPALSSSQPTNSRLQIADDLDELLNASAAAPIHDGDRSLLSRRLTGGKKKRGTWTKLFGQLGKLGTMNGGSGGGDAAAASTSPSQPASAMSAIVTAVMASSANSTSPSESKTNSLLPLNSARSSSQRSSYQSHPTPTYQSPLLSPGSSYYAPQPPPALSSPLLSPYQSPLAPHHVTVTPLLQATPPPPQSQPPLLASPTLTAPSPSLLSTPLASTTVTPSTTKEQPQLPLLTIPTTTSTSGGATTAPTLPTISPRSFRDRTYFRRSLSREERDRPEQRPERTSALSLSPPIQPQRRNFISSPPLTSSSSTQSNNASSFLLTPMQPTPPPALDLHRIGDSAFQVQSIAPSPPSHSSTPLQSPRAAHHPHHQQQQPPHHVPRNVADDMLNSVPPTQVRRVYQPLSSTPTATTPTAAVVADSLHPPPTLPELPPTARRQISFRKAKSVDSGRPSVGRQKSHEEDARTEEKPQQIHWGEPIQLHQDVEEEKMESKFQINVDATASKRASATTTNSDGSLSKRSSMRGALLIDPLTGLPIDRTKKRSSVYMGLLENNNEPEVTPSAAAAAQNLLNSLSPLHNAVVSNNLSSPSVGGPTHHQTDPMALDLIMNAVKVDKVELKPLFKAPTLMQQAKVITAAIILQRNARIAERRHAIRQRQDEADALEQELEEQARAHEAASREHHAKERLERQKRRQARAAANGGTGGGSGSGGGANDDDSLSDEEYSADDGTSSDAKRDSDGKPISRARRSYGGVNPPTDRSRGALDFSKFDFSGAGTAWSKDQIGSHLRSNKPTTVEQPKDEPKQVVEDKTPKIHPTGFGQGLITDNNGAHHPLMNPTHPNFMSHLNPNSPNYNSHINPKHPNYNPLNNPMHPDHDPEYNNPRSPKFNPFYRWPRTVQNEQLIKDTYYLHGGSTQHPAHPASPLYSPHVPDSRGNTFFTSPPKDANSSSNFGASSPRSNRSHGLRAGGYSSFPGRMMGSSGIGSVGRTVADGQFSPHPQGVGQTHMGFTTSNNTHMGFNPNLTSPKGGPASPTSPQFTYDLSDPSDPFSQLDLSGKNGIPLAQQLSRFTPAQLEIIRRETINSSLGMQTPGSPGGEPGSPMSMSKFFRETLQKALGDADIWKLAQEMANSKAGQAPGSSGSPIDRFAGISLSSLSLKAHMALFGAGAWTDSDGRPLDENGHYLDGTDTDGRHVQPIAPFPPKKFFLRDEVARYEAELREQLKKDHEERVREYEDVVNVAKRQWQSRLAELNQFHGDIQQHLLDKSNKVTEDAAFLGRPVSNQWNIY